MSSTRVVYSQSGLCNLIPPVCRVSKYVQVQLRARQEPLEPTKRSWSSGARQGSMFIVTTPGSLRVSGTAVSLSGSRTLVCCQYRCPLCVQTRGGRLASLDASFARCFVFLRTLSKISTSMFFFSKITPKHRIAYSVKNVTSNSFYIPKNSIQISKFNSNSEKFWYFFLSFEKHR